MGQVFGSTPANGVWVVPGTHKLRSVDVAAMVAAAGSERRRGSVIGQTGSGIHGTVGLLDAERIEQRSRMIGWAIAARQQRYPDEVPFDYEPLSGQEFDFDAKARRQMREYNTLDLSI